MLSKTKLLDNLINLELIINNRNIFNMKHKNTFWMNAILAVPFLWFTAFILYGNGFELFTSKLAYTTALGLHGIYMLVLAPLVSIASAYTFKSNNHVALAKVLNVLQLIFVVLIGIYVFTEPSTMTKKIMRTEFFVYIFIYVIPSIINIRTLAKIGK